MGAAAENNFGLERKAESEPRASVEESTRRHQKDHEIEALLEASGMPRKLARLFFHTQIQMIHESDK